ncbi:MAG: RNA-binding S4 domain-containing protein [Rhodobacteraceae bacterium]|nr:RNA-binding S4 domain-containing protein [Paracoccaceae bacterium]
MPDALPKLRIDKWLWHARFFKTRSLAAKQVAAGHVRVNGTRALKPAQPVAAGDVLTFAQARRVRVVRILELGARRGPAPEAQALYADLTPEPDPGRAAPAPGLDGGGRPTGRDRRQMERFRRDCS